MNTKNVKILYWVPTVLLAFFILPGIFFVNDPFAIEGSKSLGIPYWLHLEIGIGKFIGGLLLILPFIPSWLKEWAYVALGIDFISAFIGHTAMFGVRLESFFPLLMFAVLLLSYWGFHKMKNLPNPKEEKAISGAFA